MCWLLIRLPADAEDYLKHHGVEQAAWRSEEAVHSHAAVAVATVVIDGLN